MISTLLELSTKNQLESATALLKRFYQAPLFWKFYEASLKRWRIAVRRWMQFRKHTYSYWWFLPPWTFNEKSAQISSCTTKKILSSSPVLEILRSLPEASTYSSARVDAISQMEQSVRSAIHHNKPCLAHSCSSQLIPNLALKWWKVKN